MVFSNRAKICFMCLIAMLFGVVVYLSSLPNPFIWDDISLIVNNSHIKNLSSIPRLFTENIYHRDMLGHFYRPILMTTFALDCNFWFGDALGFHLTNLFFHLANGLLVFYIVYIIFKRPALSFLTAMLFVLHPIQTEAVTYISGRADPLSAFFCFSSLVFFMKYLDNNRSRKNYIYYAASILLLMPALLSKETSLIFPLIFILYEVCFTDKRFGLKQLYKYLPFAVLFLIYAVVRHVALRDVHNAVLVSEHIALGSRLLTIPPVILTYLKLLFFPVGLHMERMEYAFDAPRSLLDARVVYAMVLLVFIGALIWLFRKRLKAAPFGFFWFLILLLPVSNIVPINALVAEHWLYLPSVGFFLIVSSVFIKLIDFRSTRLYAIVILVDIFLLLGALTVKQNYIWRDPLTFYRYTLKHSPHSARLHTNLGVEYFKRGLYKRAEEEYKKAIELVPFGIDTFYSYVNLGVLYDTSEEDDKAIGFYEKAIEIAPEFFLPYLYIGNIYYCREKYEKAIEWYGKAVSKSPNNDSCWNNLANAYLKIKRLDEAQEAYKRALSLNPHAPEVHLNLGGIYAKRGDSREALKEYYIAMTLAPESPDIYYCIGNVCAQIGAFEQAKFFWKKTLELDPAYKKAEERLKGVSAKAPEIKQDVDKKKKSR